MGPYNDTERHLALQRATRLCRLFNQNFFDKIVDIIQDKAKCANVDPPQEFKDACNMPDPNFLTEAEIVWLWNYLRHCEDNPLVTTKKGKWSDKDVKERLAGTGW
jgi:hypothetical protein